MFVICVVCHNRKPYTRDCIESLVANTSLPHRIVAVDNASTDGTPQYLRGMLRVGAIQAVILNDENLYPGAACNQGWREGIRGMPDATYLVRSDNDMLYERGWDREVHECFQVIPALGQVSTMNMDEHWRDRQGPAPVVPLTASGKTVNVYWNSVGGNTAIRRIIWDDGLRYSEKSWKEAPYEDRLLSKHIGEMGWIVGAVLPKLVRVNHSRDDEYTEYYKITLRDRGFSEAEIDQRVAEEVERRRTGY